MEVAEAKLVVDGYILKQVVKALNVLVSEARFYLQDTGLEVRVVDPANVAMVVINIPKDSFEVYDANGVDMLGVDVSRLWDIIKSVRKGDICTIKANEESITVELGKLKYGMSLIDPTSIRKPPKVPSLDLPARIVLRAEDLKTGVMAADKLSDQVVLRVDGDGFYMEAEGDVDKIRLYLSESELIEFSKDGAIEVRSAFSLEYLKEFVKVAEKDDLTTIRLATNYPVKITFNVVDGKAKVTYILAPRVDVE